jgi:hypothetical protein
MGTRIRAMSGDIRFVMINAMKTMTIEKARIISTSRPPRGSGDPTWYD